MAATYFSWRGKSLDPPATSLREAEERASRMIELAHERRMEHEQLRNLLAARVFPHGSGVRRDVVVLGKGRFDEITRRD